MFEDEIPVGRAIDLRGKTFGKLTVLYRVKNRGKKPCWKCQCKCGNICEVRGDSLQQGLTKACGCLMKEKAAERFNDLTNQKFGKLTVIEKTDKRSDGHIVWRCLCDCGNETEVSSADLKSGNTRSCGCIRSLGNQAIQSYLQKKDIDFQTEYIFDDLRTSKNGKPRFDFAIFKDNKLICFIEYQGIQHYKDFGYFGK